MSTRPPMIPNEVLLIELAYFLALFILSLGIYFQTRKFQSFSFHRGIRFFRDAFLSFALIYLFRFLVLDLQLLPSTFSVDWIVTLRQIGMFLIAFFSFFAIFSLLSSLLWKRYRFISEYKLSMLSLFAASVVFFVKVPIVLFIVGAAALVILTFSAVQRYRMRQRVFSPIFLVYALLFLFFLFDLVPSIQEITPLEFEIIGYIGSIAVFAYLNIKIKKVFTSGKEEEK
jgi:hypothetical protein